MYIYGKKGLGSMLKMLLEITFVIIVIAMIAIPFKIAKVLLFYPNLICFLIIMLEFIGLFNQLEKEEPFCEKTIKRINGAKMASLICSIIWLLQLTYEVVLVNSVEFVSYAFFAFMFLLFAGVAIALYILKELFIKATNYKKENDLTI